MSKNPVLGPFWGAGQFSRKIGLFKLFEPYGPLTSLQKTNEPILRTLRHGRTETRTDGDTDGPEFIGPLHTNKTDPKGHK